MDQCNTCGRSFFNNDQMGGMISEGGCPDCTPNRSQPNPIKSEMELRNMPLPGELPEDSGGNPLKEGPITGDDGGWQNRMKRDEAFSSVQKDSTDFGMGPDPVVCQTCGGRMSEPVQMTGSLTGSNGWIQKCTKCGRSRQVAGGHPLIQQMQNQDPYPELLKEVGPERPWAVASNWLSHRQRIFAPWNKDTSRLAGDIEIEQTQIIEPGPSTVEVSSGEDNPIILQHDNPDVLDEAKRHLESKIAAPALVPAAIEAAPEVAALAGEAAPAIAGAGEAALGAGANALKSVGGTVVNGAKSLFKGIGDLFGGGEEGKGAWDTAKGLYNSPAGQAFKWHNRVNTASDLMNGVLGTGDSGGGGMDQGGFQPEDTPVEYLSHRQSEYDRPGSDDKLVERKGDERPGDVDPHEFKDEEDKGLYDDTKNDLGGSQSPKPEFGHDDEHGEGSENELGDEIYQQIDSLLPLLLHYYNSEESGRDDPMVQSLHQAIDQQHPGYLDQADHDPRLKIIFGEAHKVLQGGQGIQKESPEPHKEAGASGILHGPQYPEEQVLDSSYWPDCPLEHCPHCGYYARMTLGRCPNCHEVVYPTPEAATLRFEKGGGVAPSTGLSGPSPMPSHGFCPYCGSTTNPGKSQCEQCGANVAGIGGIHQGSTHLGAPMPPGMPPGPGAPPGGPPQGAGGPPMMMPPPPPPPGSAGSQGPKTPEQCAAVAGVLEEQGRGHLITDMLQNPDNYGEELALAQKKDSPPQLDADQSPVPAQEEAPPGDTMPMPNPADSPQPISSVRTAVDSLAPTCPVCDGHTTGLIGEDGDVGCKTCGHRWTLKDNLVESRTADVRPNFQGEPAADQLHQYNPEVDQDSSHIWVDSSGIPLEQGHQYEMYTAGMDIPDIVTITSKKPDGIRYEISGEYGLRHETEVTKEEANLDGLSFVPFGGMESQNGSPSEPSSDSDNLGSHGAPTEQSDLSTPHQMTGSLDWLKDGMPERVAGAYTQQELPGLNRQRCNCESATCDHPEAACQRTATGDQMRYVGPCCHQCAQNMINSGGAQYVTLVGEAGPRTAGKHYTPMEERALIDEPGSARNLDKLDLTHTHYLDDDFDAALFL